MELHGVTYSLVIIAYHPSSEIACPNLYLHQGGRVVLPIPIDIGISLWRQVGLKGGWPHMQTYANIL